MSIATPASHAARVHDEVMIDSYEGFGGRAVVVETRDGDAGKWARCKVRLLDDSQPRPFWAHNFEVTELFPDRQGRYDSRIDTIEHIRQVQGFLDRVIYDLSRRKVEHDRSKLASPEAEVFDEYTPKLKGTTYGSDEYKSYLAAMKPALDHHYAHNDHHPEYSALSGNGVDISQADLASGAAIRRMSLLEILEMLCDWKAATLRHADGDIRKSIEINQKRFGYSDELKEILLNTLRIIEHPPRRD